MVCACVQGGGSVCTRPVCEPGRPELPPAIPTGLGWTRGPQAAPDPGRGVPACSGTSCGLRASAPVNLRFPRPMLRPPGAKLAHPTVGCAPCRGVFASLPLIPEHSCHPTLAPAAPPRLPVPVDLRVLDVQSVEPQAVGGFQARGASAGPSCGPVVFWGRLGHLLFACSSAAGGRLGVFPELVVAR